MLACVREGVKERQRGLAGSLLLLCRIEYVPYERCLSLKMREDGT